MDCNCQPSYSINLLFTPLNDIQRRAVSLIELSYVFLVSEITPLSLSLSFLEHSAYRSGAP